MDICALQLENAKVVLVENRHGFFKGADIDCNGLPEFCRVLVEAKPGENSLIYIEVWLPKDWNGLFVGLGNGAMGGINNHADMAVYIKQGYAVSNADLGTSRGKESGAHNPDVWKDFGYRASGLIGPIGKQVLRAYYGQKERFSYFIGGSTGGQQALCLAQRFPEEYDGIIAAVPGLYRTGLHTYFLWNHRHLFQEGQNLFTQQEAEQITDSAAAFFQELGDGEKGDNFVTFPYRDENTITDFMRYLSRNNPDLSKEQLAALQAVYQGPIHKKTGEQIHAGMPIGSECFGGGLLSYQAPDSLNFFPFLWAFGADYDVNQFDFGEDFDALQACVSDDLDATDADVSAFLAHGGKLLMFSGSADSCVPFAEAMEYYNRVCEKMGGYEAIQDQFRYFIMPGKDHNWGGRGGNQEWCDEKGTGVLEALRKWVETDVQPDYLVAAHVDSETEEVCFTRRVYPYTADKKMGTQFPQTAAKRFLK